MTNQYTSILGNRTLINVGGKEAEAFLQGIVTCDIEKIRSNGAGFGGLLSPQGKILFDFFVIRKETGFWLDVDKSAADDLIKRLTFYRLRADVDIEMQGNETIIIANWADPEPEHEGAIVVADPRLAQMGWRIYASAGSVQDHASRLHHYHDHRITLGMPEGGIDYKFGEAFPHEALFDQIGGVDFSKGCYVGQEVISRMHHRGTARKRLIQASASCELQPAGGQITASGKPIGELTSTSRTQGIANIRLDRARKAILNAEDIIANDITLELKIQPWVNFDWPEV